MINAKTLPDCRWLKGGVLALAMGLLTPPVLAVLSNDVGPIHGRIPTASGDLLALFPGGTTLVSDHARVRLTQRPDQFTVSPLTTGLTPQDADGDSGLSLSVNLPAASLTWKHNGTPLTAAQLAAPFGDNFPNQTLTLEVSAPVTVSSVSGLPTTAVQSYTTAYQLQVPSIQPMPASVKVQVNGYTFGGTDGFPTTGFAGAYFDFWMDGTSTAGNAAYDWSVDQPWLLVSNGWVLLTMKPGVSDSKTAQITATDRITGDAQRYTLTLGNWFVSKGGTSTDRVSNWSDANAWCGTSGNGALPTRADLTAGAGWRQIGSLWGEWGRVSNYGNAGFPLSGSFGTSEQDGTGSHYGVNLSNGYVGSLTDTIARYVACVQGF